MFSPIHLYRISHALHVRGFPRVAAFVKLVNFLIFKTLIPPHVVMGRRVKIMHQGIALVMHPNVVIGDDVTIYHSVTLATDNANEDPQKLTIGDGATIYPHSILIGPVAIGARSIVGAGSVVTVDVPAGAVVFGNPARVRTKTR